MLNPHKWCTHERQDNVKTKIRDNYSLNKKKNPNFKISAISQILSSFFEGFWYEFIIQNSVVFSWFSLVFGVGSFGYVCRVKVYSS